MTFDLKNLQPIFTYLTEHQTEFEDWYYSDEEHYIKFVLPPNRMLELEDLICELFEQEEKEELSKKEGGDNMTANEELILINAEAFYMKERALYTAVKAYDLAMKTDTLIAAAIKKSIMTRLNKENGEVI